MKRSAVNAVGCALGLWFLAGCSSFRTELGRPPSTKPAFAEGTTRVAAVLHELGPPHQVSRLSSGFAFLYEYSCMREFQLGFNVNYPVLRYFKFVKAWNGLDQQVLLLTFDDRGVLQSVGAKGWKEDLGGGSAVQILVAVASLSDISELLHPADANSWGSGLLQPVPIALNAGQSVHTGAHGLQQRIAPRYAGQETLEMSEPYTEKQKRKIKKNYQEDWGSQ
jgi:hypothetical protein